MGIPRGPEDVDAGLAGLGAEHRRARRRGHPDRYRADRCDVSRVGDVPSRTTGPAELIRDQAVRAG